MFKRNPKFGPNGNQGGQKDGTNSENKGSKSAIPSKDDLLKKLAKVMSLQLLPMPKEPPASWAVSDSENLEEKEPENTNSRHLRVPKSTKTKRGNSKEASPSGSPSYNSFATPPLESFAIPKSGLSFIKTYPLKDNEFYIQQQENPPCSSTSKRSLEDNSNLEAKHSKSAGSVEPNLRKPVEEKPKVPMERNSEHPRKDRAPRLKKVITNTTSSNPIITNEPRGGTKRTSEAISRDVTSQLGTGTSNSSNSRTTETYEATSSKMSKTESKPKVAERAIPPSLTREEKFYKCLQKYIKEFEGKIGGVKIDADDGMKVNQDFLVYICEYKRRTFKHGKALREMAKEWTKEPDTELLGYLAYLESMFWYLKSSRYELFNDTDPMVTFKNCFSNFPTIDACLNFFYHRYEHRHLYAVLSLMKHFVCMQMLEIIEPYCTPNLFINYKASHEIAELLSETATACYFDSQLCISSEFDKCFPKIPLHFDRLHYTDFPLASVDEPADLDLLVGVGRRVYYQFLQNSKLNRFYDFVDDSLRALGLKNEPPRYI